RGSWSARRAFRPWNRRPKPSACFDQRGDVTDRFPDFEPQTATFRADLPTRKGPMVLRGRGARLMIVGLVSGVLFTILVFAWIQLAWLSGLPKVPGVDALWSLNRAPGMTFLDRKGAT